MVQEEISFSEESKNIVLVVVLGFPVIVTVMVFVVRFHNHCLDIHVFCHPNNMKFHCHPSHCGHDSKVISDYSIGGCDFEVDDHHACTNCYNKKNTVEPRYGHLTSTITSPLRSPMLSPN